MWISVRMTVCGLEQVPYGKHSPVAWKGKYHTGANVGRWTTSGGLLELKNMLPVVIVKDPLTWMGSMCRQRCCSPMVENETVQICIFLSMLASS